MSALVQAVVAAAPETGGLLLVVALVAAVAALGRRQELRRAAARRQVRTTVRRDRPGRVTASQGWAADPPDPALPSPADPWEDAEQDAVDYVRLTLLDICPAGAR